MDRARVPRDALVVLACAAFVAALAVAAVVAGPGPQRLWRRYLTLLVRDGLDVREALIGAGVRHWVDPRTARVSFTVFSGREQVSLAELTTRLDPLDPRLDPYMRSLSAWFAAEAGWGVVYVRLDRPAPLLVVGLLARMPPYGRTWRIADWAPATGLASVVAAAALVVFAALGRLRGRPAIAALSIAAAGWVPALARGGPSDLAAFFLLAAAWMPGIPEALDAARDRLIRPGDPRGTRLSDFAPFAAALAVAIAVRVVTEEPVVPLALLAAAFPAGAAAAVALERLRQSLGQHAVFQPLRLAARRDPDPPVAARLRGLVPLALALPILAFGLLPGPEMRVPAPQRIRGAHAYSWRVLERLWTEGAASAIPDLADYVVHVAYQGALAYGRPYGFPTADVILPAFVPGQEPGRIQRTEEVVIRYDDEWLKQTLAQPLPGSVERLLLDQRSPVRVKYTALGTVSAGVLLWNGLMMALYGALVFLPLESLRRGAHDRLR